MSYTPERSLQSQIVELLGRGRRKARFVSEIAGQLDSAQGIDAELEELEASGRVLIREQYCGDPHLEGSDLRIVALIREERDVDPASDALSRAIADIDATWNRWLGDYLANHRCG
jgi:hypothetical protein